jgi:hypothetical protein
MARIVVLSAAAALPDAVIEVLVAARPLISILSVATIIAIILRRVGAVVILTTTRLISWLCQSWQTCEQESGCERSFSLWHSD